MCSSARLVRAIRVVGFSSSGPAVFEGPVDSRPVGVVARRPVVGVELRWPCDGVNESTRREALSGVGGDQARADADAERDADAVGVVLRGGTDLVAALGVARAVTGAERLDAAGRPWLGDCCFLDGMGSRLLCSSPYRRDARTGR